MAARPGQGSFRLVRASAGTQVLPSREISDREAVDIFELRYLIETGAAELAAQRRSAGDLERMKAALWRMTDALVSGADAVSDDDAFHVAVAAATHNPQIERFQVFMGRQFSDSRAPTWSADGHRIGRARDAQAEHARIFDAIVAGDAVAARAAAAAHLIGAAQRLGLDARRWGAAVETETVRAAQAQHELESER